jgi:L-ascorbate metabolism protein UlaG (beta-lactamase superfamily)
MTLGGTLTWTGVAGLILEFEGHRLAIDPFVSRPGLARSLLSRPRPDRALVSRSFPGLEAVLVGHTHYDHAMDLSAVVEASPRAVVYGSAMTIELCRRSGVGVDALREAGDGDRVEVGPFSVDVVGSEHGVVPVLRWLDPGRLPRRGAPRVAWRFPCGPVLAFRVEVEERSFHIHGSAGIDDSALAGQPPADVLVACLAARQGTPEYLDRLARVLRPKVLIPSHHDSFLRPLSRPPRPVWRLDWAGFQADAQRLLAAYGTRVHTLARGVPVAF